jgi:hypothetical protein
MISKAIFKSEAELCATFIKQVPKDWVAYPETCGFDIVLVRPSDGCQIGVEAKMTLNAKVLLQAVETTPRYRVHNPDFRAVLVPWGTAGSEMMAIARKLWITVIQMKSKELYLALRRSTYSRLKFEPELPDVLGREWYTDTYWRDCAPAERLQLPEYVPDVRAGASAPSTLSEWKIKAIKICVLLEKRGTITIDDFRQIGIDRRRFMEMGWIQQHQARGQYVVGKYPLDLRRQHPRNYVEIEAHFDRWAPPIAALQIEAVLV